MAELGARGLLESSAMSPSTKDLVAKSKVRIGSSMKLFLRAIIMEAAKRCLEAP